MFLARMNALELVRGEWRHELSIQHRVVLRARLRDPLVAARAHRVFPQVVRAIWIGACKSVSRQSFIFLWANGSVGIAIEQIFVGWFDTVAINAFKRTCATRADSLHRFTF